MRINSSLLNYAYRLRLASRTRAVPAPRRCLLTLAIETSCDDTSVAVLEKTKPNNRQTNAILHFHKKITSNNTEYHGVHPLASLYSHQENLASLVDEAILHLPPHQLSDQPDGASNPRSRRQPDFISVTRGPGMRSNLFTGIDTAKGLAVAWQIDVVGVHHMQAHALTPRLVAALQNAQRANQSSNEVPYKIEPAFPFLSVLASGGHTLLISSASLTDHKVLASTNDIAVGECLDKVARVVLPPGLLRTARTTMYGALLEKFAFSDLHDAEICASSIELEMGQGNKVKKADEYHLEDNTVVEYQAMYAAQYAYTIPKNNEEALERNISKWGWAFNQPLTKAAGGLKRQSMEMSFSGLMTSVERAVQFNMDATTGKLTKVERSADAISMEERKDMAREAMRAAFEHVASRVVLGLQQVSNVKTVVMSGGVAANSYLRYILASTLASHGFSNIRIIFPPPSLCTDNAAMIGWAGLEMYEAGFIDPRTFRAIRKWPLDQILSPPKDN